MKKFDDVVFNIAVLACVVSMGAFIFAMVNHFNHKPYDVLKEHKNKIVCDRPGDYCYKVIRLRPKDEYFD